MTLADLVVHCGGGPDDYGELSGFLDELINRPAWHALAACRGQGPSPYFPEGGDTTEQAKAVCSACPVRLACLADALADPERSGVWGGTSPGERRQMRRTERLSA